jgi:transcription-repair coupling factor (superfamily II helicase)
MFISKLDSSSSGIRIGFTEKSPFDPASLLMRVQKEPDLYRLSPDGNLTLLHQSDNRRKRLKGCIAFLDSLQEDAVS